MSSIGTTASKFEDFTIACLCMAPGIADFMVQQGLALESDRQDSSHQSPMPDNQLFTQTLSLPVGSLSAARKSVNIMIGRLSPVPVEGIVWDLIGPLEKKGEKHLYRLGILKKQALDQFRADDRASAHIIAPSGETFKFIDQAGFERIGKNMAKWLILLAACYVAILWSLVQWGEEIETTAQDLNRQSAVASREITQSKTSAATAETELALIASFENNSETTRHFSHLAAISGSLDEKGWLSSIEISGQRLQLSGYAAQPSDIVRKLGLALPGANIRLGSINADRVTGLNRFSMTVTIPTASKTTEASQ